MSLTELEELRRELKRERVHVIATMLGQKIVSQSTLQKLAILHTAIEAVSSVIAQGGIPTTEHPRGRSLP
jgi:hypothetical protein